MPRKRFWGWAALVVLAATGGCRSFCEKHYCPHTQPVCCQPCAPVCCQPCQPVSYPAPAHYPATSTNWSQPGVACVPCK